MRLGETGLNISDYLDAVEDEILRDSVGELYYKSSDGNIISTSKASRTGLVIDYILDKFHIHDSNLEANIFIFPGHPIELTKLNKSTIYVGNEYIRDGKCVLFCDTISANDENDIASSTMNIDRNMSLTIDGTSINITSGKLIDISKYINPATNNVSLVASKISSNENYKLEYLIGIYLLILKEV